MKIYFYLLGPLALTGLVGLALGPKSEFGRALMGLGLIYARLLLLLLFLFGIWVVVMAAKGTAQIAKEAIEKEKRTGRIQEFLTGVLGIIWYAFVGIAILIWLSSLFGGYYNTDYQ